MDCSSADCKISAFLHIHIFVSGEKEFLFKPSYLPSSYPNGRIWTLWTNLVLICPGACEKNYYLWLSMQISVVNVRYYYRLNIQIPVVSLSTFLHHIFTKFTQPYGCNLNKLSNVTTKSHLHHTTILQKNSLLLLFCYCRRYLGLRKFHLVIPLTLQIWFQSDQTPREE